MNYKYLFQQLQYFVKMFYSKNYTVNEGYIEAGVAFEVCDISEVWTNTDFKCSKYLKKK